MSNLIFGIVIAILVVVYILLKKSQHQDKNLPAVSEDVNLPAVSESNPPMVNEANPPMKNEPLDNDRPQQ